jgi:hypothetical protein
LTYIIASARSARKHESVFRCIICYMLVDDSDSVFSRTCATVLSTCAFLLIHCWGWISPALGCLLSHLCHSQLTPCCHHGLSSGSEPALRQRRTLVFAAGALTLALLVYVAFSPSSSLSGGFGRRSLAPHLQQPSQPPRAPHRRQEQRRCHTFRGVARFVLALTWSRRDPAATDPATTGRICSIYWAWRAQV